MRLASDDPNVDPEVDFAMLSDPVDRRRLRIGVERLLEVLDHRAMRALGTPIVAPYDDAGLTPTSATTCTPPAPAGWGRWATRTRSSTRRAR